MTLTDIIIVISCLTIVGLTIFINIKNRNKIDCGNGCSCSAISNCREVRVSDGKKKTY
jgi:hypothetical protein